MTQPLVVIVAPERPLNVHEREQYRRTEDLRREVQREAETRGWKTKTFRTRLHRSTRPAESNRRLHLLGGCDAADIYDLTHTADVAVIQLGEAARVMPHPRQEPSLSRAISLADFVRHKGFFAAVSSRLSYGDAYDAFADTLELTECDGDRDPRCLPMHVFAPAHDHTACPLTDADAVKRKYGPPGELTDHRGRAWDRPRGRHGGGPLRIRGAEIGAGFHWDVASIRTISEMTTTTEIWSLPPGAYLNVAPNASVRKGQSSARATAKRTLVLSRDAEARSERAGHAPSRRAARVKRGRTG